MRSLPRRGFAVSLALLPNAVLAVLAVVGTPPLAVHVPATIRAGSQLTRLHITVANRSGARLQASYSVGLRGHGHPWRILTGPVVLAPGQRAAITLAPDRPPKPVDSSWRVTVFTSRPPAFVSVPLRVRNAPPRQGLVRAAT